MTKLWNTFDLTRLGHCSARSVIGHMVKYRNLQAALVERFLHKLRDSMLSNLLQSIKILLRV